MKACQGQGITFPRGFQAAGLFAGFKRAKKDFSLVYSEEPCAAAGVFTSNSVKAAPVLLSQQKLPNGFGAANAVAIVAGVANACTGEQGLENEAKKVAWVAGELGLPPERVLTASTGVIGKHLDVGKLLALKGLKAALSDSGLAALDAAQAILTTDSVEKTVAVQGKGFRVAGMAKGSGMIHPNMATMLAVICSDAVIDAAALKAALKQAVDKSFNMISVDGDMSTNDCVFALANGASGVKPSVAEFQEALDFVCLELAKKIVADGEGATKTFAVKVKGAAREAQAVAFAKAVASSNLVKAAIHGGDLNWGRVFSAMGSTGQAFDLGKVALFVGPVKVFNGGGPQEFDRALALEVLSARHLEILVDLGIGRASATAFGCDLSEEYVKINSAYCT